MSTCIVTPTIKVENQEVDSKLFRELTDYTGNRESAQELWALSQVEEFVESLEDIEYDENGEPTFESYSKAIDIKSYLNGDISLKGLKQEAGVTDKNGKPIKYHKAEKAIKNAISFNEENPDYVASVKKVDSEYVIDVEEKDFNNSDVPQKVVFHNALNNKLLGILRSVGFDVKVDENSSYAGIFNPVEATVTADGLRTIIQIAKGQRGEQAFPEEFSHAMIAGLGNHPLVIRLLDSIDTDTVEEVLGDQFENYSKAYNNDRDRLKKEAAGKLLQKYITGESYSPKQKNLLSRLWNWIKERLNILKESEINNAINEANREAGELAQFIISDSVTDAIDTDLILQEKPLYDLEKEAISMENLAEKALELMSKRLKILTVRSKKGEYSESDKNAIIKMKELIERKKYTSSTIHFLSESLEQIEGLQKRLKSLSSKDTRSDSDLNKIRSRSAVLRSIKEFSDAYKDIIAQLTTLPAMLEDGEVDIEESDAENISELATKALVIINNVEAKYKKLRFNTVYHYLKTFWGEDKDLTKMGTTGNKSVTIKEKDKEGNIVEKQVSTLTLSMVMSMAEKDINGIDRWVNALSDASDPMLSLVAKAVKTSHMRRDEILNKTAIGIRAAHRKLIAAGYTPDFMYERDRNGKLTGRLISDIDFVKFNEDRDTYIKSLEKEGHSKFVIKSKVEAWERKHMESVKVKGSSSERTEMLPIKSLYGTNNLSRLNDAQRTYYEIMMAAKASLEDLIPQRYVNTYNAVQISKDMTEAVTENLGNPKKAVQLILERAKSKFVRRADDTGFGEDVADKNKNILLNFAGNPIEKLPVYYTSPLNDTENLSTDFTASILAYAGMAVNYGEMSKVIDVLELTRDLIKDREVQQTSGGSKLVESYKVLHKKFNNAYTQPGNKTNIGARIDDYYASVIYDKQKKDEGTLGKTNLDQAKTLDSIKSYTGAVGLGLNLFSAISNITVGKLQILIESIGGEYFGIKNSINGKKNYYKDLPAYLAEINSTQKTSKMGLLIDKFDALEEFYNGLQYNGYYKGALSRIIGRGNLFILNNMGEHYLHTRTMLAMLDAYRVKEGGVEKSLYDVMDVVNKDGEYSIEIRDGVTDINGNPITEDKLLELKMRIGKVNQSLNGAFNEDDKGAIHKYALGRMAMQFRQWMPAHYNRRFAGTYYDAALDQYREGFYTTLGKFTWETLKDIRRAKFEVATRWNSLNNHEKANMRRAAAEIAIFCMLTGLIALMGPEKDRKGMWYDRMITYQLKRMKLETGASAPITPDFLKNINTLLQSPAASIKSFNNIAGLLEFWNIFNEIESGRYKGWSEYERNVSQLLPIYGQIKRTLDLSTEDYMFTVLNKN